MLSTKIEALITNKVSAHGPGVAIAIVKDGQTLYRQGHGLANLEWQIAITPATVFGLGSVTKPFTATAMVLLEQQGKLRLSDALQTYLPDYPAYEHEITLMHLLTHTSGIPNFITQPGFWKYHAYTNSLEDVIALFKDLPLDFEPGSAYSYSNSGYLLLGLIIEKLLDMDYGQALQHLIFEPLGMTHSCYMRSETIIPYRAGGYEREGGTYQNARGMSAETKHAAGALGSTLDDMLRWQQALRAGQLLDHAAQARMDTPLTLNNGRRENYGLGWAPGSYRGHAFRCHAGGVPGYSSFIGYFPQDDLTILLLSNLGSFDCAELARQITNLLLELPTPVYPTCEPAPERFTNMIGSYSGLFGTLKIHHQGSQLYLDGRVPQRFIPIDESSFYQANDPDVTLHFEDPDASGRYQRLRKIQPFFWFTVTRQ
ncbi:hypothetical protein KDA_41310 [Dictyobacter alpinus]|uniref:Beta-lactamase-related domain-containing protein n=1 Tax=Dictyobacter alpinus TaxID=2014873 RepID=A0A402BBJ7_9CHLR|nr:serine hydrolase domain-containing protein [Dictyobacter alpinus]GCE28647.1 hypothetical protein KDA_41310 [Dictyobacter alpinus]